MLAWHASLRAVVSFSLFLFLTLARSLSQVSPFLSGLSLSLSLSRSLSLSLSLSLAGLSLYISLNLYLLSIYPSISLSLSHSSRIACMRNVTHLTCVRMRYACF